MPRSGPTSAGTVRSRTSPRALALLLAIVASVVSSVSDVVATPTDWPRKWPLDEPNLEGSARDRSDDVVDRINALEGPVDRATYTLGPGDVVVVTITGPVQKSVNTVITAEGTLIVPPAIGFRVAGVTVAEAEDLVRAKLSPFYQGVSVRLDLLTARKFTVYVLGMVVTIGDYVADGATRVSTVVKAAGGVLSTASIRRIHVLRADGTTLEVDLLRFLLLGDNSANPMLRDGDRVVVPLAGETVAVLGSVGRPGEYEVVPGETIADLVRLAGGTMPQANRARAELRRFIGDDGSETVTEIIDLDGATAATPMHPGDQLSIYARPDWHLRNIVEVEGEVLYPGPYVINEGSETLTQLIARAGGFRPLAAIHEATLTRTVSADSGDAEFERLKRIDVADMTRDEYEYFKLKSREQPGRVVVDFEALFREGSGADDILLRRGDRIEVPTASQSVKVIGQVAAPGSVTFEEGKSIRWYIDRAGGYGWRASKGKTRVIRANTGEWIAAGDVEVLEVGDTIWVPEKPERDYWALFKEGLTLVGQIATLYLVVDRISN